MVRLLKYKRVLLQLQSVGLEKVFSNNLSDALDISSALVRKDFSHFVVQIVEDPCLIFAFTAVE